MSARFAGRSQVTVCEFGVARGAGLLNLIELAEVIAPAAGVTFRIVGFDTGAGLPPVTGHKNHPEIWAGGDFPMVDSSELIKTIAGRADCILGDVNQTVGRFYRNPDGRCASRLDIHRCGHLYRNHERAALPQWQA